MTAHQAPSTLAASGESSAIRTRRRRLTWRRGRRTVIGLAIILSAALLAAGASLISGYDPNFGDYSQTLQAPSTSHLFGTDTFGRDIFSRVLAGLRVSLIVAFASVVPAVAIGIPLGLIAGYQGRLLDNLIMRPLDLLISFPPILLAITLVAMFGTLQAVTILALIIIWIPIMTRIIRSSVITVRNEEFVEAAKAIGAGTTRISVRHVLPNSLGQLVVQASISLGIAILIEAALSFVGLGTQPPDPSLGGMLAENKNFMREAPWSVVFPGLTIMIVVLGFNLLGDGIRDLMGPRGRS